jgi:hypothetical protein
VKGLDVDSLLRDASGGAHRREDRLIRYGKVFHMSLILSLFKADALTKALRNRLRREMDMS